MNIMDERLNGRLMSNVTRFYRNALQRNKEGRGLLRSLGISDDSIAERFELGYADGSLQQALPRKGGVREVLREIGFFDEKGNEKCAASLTIPIKDANHDAVGFVAVTASGGQTVFPPSCPPLGVNRDALRESAVIFSGSALDVLRFAQAGFLNALPVNKELSPEERALIERHRPKKAFLATELPETLRLLQKLEVPCFRLTVAFPASPEQVAEAVKTAEPVGTALGPDATVRVLDNLLRFECGARRYELRELAAHETDRLRVLLRAQAEQVFHTDTLDLYAGRSRTSFARAAAGLFGVSDSAIEADLCLMIRKLEAMRAARQEEGESAARYVMTPDEEAEALAYLKKPDLLDCVVKDLKTLGYVGEETNKKIGYLITLSRKLESPLCGVIISRAGAGKSRLMEVLSEIVPPEDLVAFTRITPQALYYAENKSFKNKLLVSGEDEGLIGSDYALRELISSKKIKLAAPLKDAATGKLKTVEYEVEGPISLLFSTTKPAIHFENATRCFTLSLDESADQTEQIHVEQRRLRTAVRVESDAAATDLRRLHKNVQRLLKPVLVVNPFAMELTFPAQPLEMRREHEKYLSLIDTLALLRQYQRPRKQCAYRGRDIEYAEVAVEDIEEANRLMTEILGTKAEELSKPSRDLLKLIRKMAEERSRELEITPKDYRFNRRDIREYTGWSDNQIKAHIRQLEELEYLLVGKGDRGRMYRYELDLEQKEEKRLPGLTDTAILRAKVGKLAVVGNGGASHAESVLVEKQTESLKVGQNGRKALTPREHARA